MGSLTGVNFGTITNSCWPASGDLKAVGNGAAVSADVVSLDAAVMEKVTTTVLPAKRTLSVEVGGFAPALISYPGTAEDMTGYLSVSGDISVASPEIADISDLWPCAVSGKKTGVTAVSFDIDLKATDFSDKDNLKPLAEAGIPVIHAAATDDEVVPVSENTDILEPRYRALGGVIEVIRHPGKHHPHGLQDPTPIINFILKHKLS